MTRVAHSPGSPSSPVATNKPPVQSPPASTKPAAQPQSTSKSAKASQQTATERLNEQKLQNSVREAQLRSAAGANLDIDGQGRVSRDYEPTRYIDVNQDAGFKSLPEVTRQKLTQDISKNSSSNLKLQKLLNHPEYDKLNTEQKSKLLNVFAEAGPQGRDALLPLLSRKVSVPGGEQSALLTTDQTKGKKSLLDHLNRTATQELAPELAGRRKELLAGIIQETARPSYHVDQGYTGHCGAANVEMHLLQNSPAEYARIVNGLASPEKKVRLANGSEMDAAKNQENKFTNFGKEYRSLSDRMFQSAIHQHAIRRPTDQDGGHGPGFIADANNSAGMGSLDLAHSLSAIYNKKFSAFPESSQAIHRAEKDPQLQKEMKEQLFAKIKEHSKNGPILVGMNWDDEKSEKFVKGHVVMVHHVDEKTGRVYFFNPQGSENAKIRRPQSEPYVDNKEIIDRARPDRRVEIAASKIESMPIEDFKRLLDGGAFSQP